MDYKLIPAKLAQALLLDVDNDDMIGCGSDFLNVFTKEARAIKQACNKAINLSARRHYIS